MSIRSVPLVLQQLLALLAVFCVAFVTLKFGAERLEENSSPFVGAHWSKPGQTLEVAELTATKFMRVESHTLRIGDEVVRGWLWVDVADQINVLVEDGDTGRFLVLRQTKYGLPEESYAVVGGLVEPGEQPLTAARRELLEELGRSAAPENWLFLGRFRTDANRGGGFVNCFLARHTRPVPPEARMPSDDWESQQVVTLTRHELLQLVTEQHFGEVKWTATVALALLRLQHEPKPPHQQQDKAPPQQHAEPPEQTHHHQQQLGQQAQAQPDRPRREANEQEKQEREREREREREKNNNDNNDRAVDEKNKN
mgnify:CR=1 FL=1